MKPTRAFVVEPAEDRARTRRRVVARGSDQPIQANLVRTRSAVVLKTEPPANAQRTATETEVVDVSSTVNTKPTRQVNAQNLFAMLNPEDPPIASAVPLARPLSPLEQSIARRENSRTRRMVLSESELVELGPDGKITGKIPLADWTAARAPSIEIEVEVPDHLVRQATQQSYRRGMFMGVAIATSVGAALATVLAFVM